MKALAFGLAAVGTIAVLLQWAFVVDHWTFLAEVGQAEITSNSTARVARYRGDDWFEKPSWYYQYVHYGFGSMMSSFVFFMLPMFALTGFRCVLNKRTVAMAACALGSVGLVFLVAFAVFSIGDNGGIYYLIYLFFAFFVNIPLLVVPASMTGGILRDRVRAPYCLAGGVTVTTNILGLLLLGVIFPLANDGSTASRLFVRIVGFTVAVEALALVMRSCTHKTVLSQFPTDRLIMLQVGIMLVPAILGRQLATQMPTSSGTVMLSVGLLLVELVMRYTLVKRDVALLSWLSKILCCDACAKCLHGKKGMQLATDPERHRIIVRMWIAYLTAESILEDTGIFLSLPIAAIFKQPPVPGTLPLGLGELFFRVFIQVFIELIVDVLPVVVHFTMTRVLGYRLPVVMPEMLHDYVDITKLRLSYKKKSSILDPRVGASATVAPGGHFSPLVEQQDAARTVQRLDDGAQIHFVSGPSHSQSASAGDASSARSMSLGDSRYFTSGQEEADPAAAADNAILQGGQSKGSLPVSTPARLSTASQTASGAQASARVDSASSDDDPGGSDAEALTASSPLRIASYGGEAGMGVSAGTRTETAATSATATEIYVNPVGHDESAVVPARLAEPEPGTCDDDGRSSAAGGSVADEQGGGAAAEAGLPGQRLSTGHSNHLDGSSTPVEQHMNGALESKAGAPGGFGGGLGGMEDAMRDQIAERSAEAAVQRRQTGTAGREESVPDAVNLRKFRNQAPCSCLELSEQESIQSFRMYVEMLLETMPETTAERQAIWTDLSFHQLSALLVAAALPVDGTQPCPRLDTGRPFVQDVLSQELYPEGFVETDTFTGNGAAVPDHQLVWYALRAVAQHKHELLGKMTVATQADNCTHTPTPSEQPTQGRVPSYSMPESVGSRSLSGQSASRVPETILATTSDLLDDSAEANAAAHVANLQRNQQRTDESTAPYIVADAAVREMVRECGLGACMDADGRVSIGTGYWIAAQAELMAQRSVHAWETRYLFFASMMFVFVFIGAQYALRTTQPALCPFFEEGGSAQQPSTWYFDDCLGGEGQTA